MMTLSLMEPLVFMLTDIICGFDENKSFVSQFFWPNSTDLVSPRTSTALMLKTSPTRARRVTLSFCHSCVTSPTRPFDFHFCWPYRSDTSNVSPRMSRANPTRPTTTTLDSSPTRPTTTTHLTQTPPDLQQQHLTQAPPDPQQQHT
ncbi:hypothetical protein NP493_138g03001 [Ridgeia piscesae]|uniref:Uncharacterized protein n=1 Tax=Ridgeia piscesae TaxID=27915 RepID=A0AAD9P511_RIDPI|nr:hypothetical protein NP493_138g03001 [Ridgeia piscesae]